MDEIEKLKAERDAAQARVAEQPEVVAWSVVAKYPHKEARSAVFFDEAQADTQGTTWCCADGVVTIIPLIDRAFTKQHDRIVAALRAELEAERDLVKILQEQNDALRSVAEAAQAKLAELEKQEPVALANRGLHAFWVKWTEAAAGLYGPGIKLYAAPVAQAGQVPDGYVLAKQTVVEMPDGKKELGYTLIDGLGIFDSSDDVIDAIKELSLPIGWVSMTVEQLLPGRMLAAAAPAQGGAA